MTPIFTGSNISELDKYTIKNEPIDGTDLVERAASTFVNIFKRKYNKQTKIYVFAGSGNNGADALAIARMLLNDGYIVESYLFNPSNKLSIECEEHKTRLMHCPINRFTMITSTFNPPIIEDNSIIIDGIFGTGLNRQVEGGFAALIKFINSVSATVIAIDIPSGLFSESNMNNNPDTIVKANYTYTFEFPKLAFFFRENEKFIGKWKILPIGLSEKGKREIKTEYFLVEDKDMSAISTERSKFSHKGTFGHSLIIAGSKGMMGAACLSAKAAIKTGLGKLTLHVPSCGYTIAQTVVPEAMCQVDTDELFNTEINLDKDYTTIGVGPGLGNYPEGARMLETLFEKYRKPMVIDADALNIIANNRDLLRKIPKDSILTPHPGELERLTTFSTNSEEQIIQAQNLAYKYNIYVILKGAYSATCMPSGHVTFNSTGNPGMATGGSGDVLFGMLVGLLSCGYNPSTAAIMANYIHGLSGDIYVAKESEESLSASDIIDHIGLAFRQLRD